MPVINFNLNNLTNNKIIKEEDLEKKIK